MICWMRYIGPTRHPLRTNQIVIRLGPIENDPEGRDACVVLVGTNNSSTCALHPTDLVLLSPTDLLRSKTEDYEGGLNG